MYTFYLNLTWMARSLLHCKSLLRVKVQVKVVLGTFLKNLIGKFDAEKVVKVLKLSA